MDYQYKAKLVRVVDGDTVIVEVLLREREEDLGFHITVYNEIITSQQSLRLADVDAPELFRGENRVAGGESRDFVERWMQQSKNNAESEWHLRVTTYKSKTSFNRYIADIYDAASYSNLGKRLVEEGYALAAQYTLSGEEIQERSVNSNPGEKSPKDADIPGIWTKRAPEPTKND